MDRVRCIILLVGSWRHVGANQKRWAGDQSENGSRNGAVVARWTARAPRMSWRPKEKDKSTPKKAAGNDDKQKGGGTGPKDKKNWVMDGDQQRWVSLKRVLTDRREYIAGEVLERIEETWDTQSPNPWGGELKKEICNFLDRHHPSGLNAGEYPKVSTGAALIEEAVKVLESTWGTGGCEVLDEALTLAWDLWCNKEVGPPAVEEMPIATPSPKKPGKAKPDRGRDGDDALIAQVAEMQSLLAEVLDRDTKSDASKRERRSKKSSKKSSKKGSKKSGKKEKKHRSRSSSRSNSGSSNRSHSGSGSSRSNSSVSETNSEKKRRRRKSELIKRYEMLSESASMIAVKAAKKCSKEGKTYQWSATHSEQCSIPFLLRVYRDHPSCAEWAKSYLQSFKMLESREGEGMIVAAAMLDCAVLQDRLPLDCAVVEMGARRVHGIEELLTRMAAASNADEKKAAQSLFQGYDVVNMSNTNTHILREALKLSRHMQGKM